MRGVFSNTIIAISTLAAMAGAEEASVLPQRPPVSRYQAQWKQSAFNREVVRPVTTEIRSDFARTLVLEGIINDGKKGPKAFLRDTSEDNAFFFITKEKSKGTPYYIEEAHLADDPTQSTVKVTDGRESAMLTFDESIITSRVEPPAPAPGSRQGKNAGKEAAARQAARERPSTASRGNETPPPSNNRPPAEGDEADPADNDEDDPAERILSRARRRVIPPPSEN